MASAAMTTADWVQAERRKQNAVILVVILACLIVAFFPRNERRLFTWPGAGSLLETISAPFQTRLRDDGLSGVARKKPKPERTEVVLPLSQPQIEGFTMLPDPMLDSLMGSTPQQFDFPLPNIKPDEIPQPEHLLTNNFRPHHFGPPPVYLGGVPEPGTWALLILGIGFVMWRIREVRRQARRKRWRERWRRGLVPAPV